MRDDDLVNIHKYLITNFQFFFRRNSFYTFSEIMKPNKGILQSKNYVFFDEIQI